MPTETAPSTSPSSEPHAAEMRVWISYSWHCAAPAVTRAQLSSMCRVMWQASEPFVVGTTTT
jgi:hypothetical protein